MASSPPIFQEIEQFSVHKLGLLFLGQVSALLQRHCSDKISHSLSHRFDVEHFTDGLEVSAPHREDGAGDQHMSILKILCRVFRSSAIVIEAPFERSRLRVRLDVFCNFFVREQFSVVRPAGQPAWSVRL